MSDSIPATEYERVGESRRYSTWFFFVHRPVPDFAGLLRLPFHIRKTCLSAALYIQYTTFVWDPLSLSDCRLLRECPSVNIGIPLFTKMPAGYYCRSSSSHVLSGTMNAGVERNRQLHCTCPLPVCPQRINMSGDMLDNFIEWQFIST